MCEAEIHEVREVTIVDEDVVGFDVTVNQPGTMRRIESVADLADDPQRTLGRQGPVLDEQGAQVAPVNQAHVDEQATVDVTPVVDRDHVWIVEACGDA